MKVIKVEDFYKELKKYPVEMGMVSKSWISEIFNKIQFDIKGKSKVEIIEKEVDNNAE